jgi:four helix bundle protein
MQDFKNLHVWRKAHELALFTYKITVDFPRDELFGLRNTLRKTSVDIPAYIAEGCAKASDGEFAKAIGTSLALGNRLEYYALMAKDLEMIPEAVHSDYLERIVEVRKMLSGFNRRLETGTL